eukprot:20294-Pleurochrysis_carterae.AAC.1
MASLGLPASIDSAVDARFSSFQCVRALAYDHGGELQSYTSVAVYPSKIRPPLILSILRF